MRFGLFQAGSIPVPSIFYAKNTHKSKNFVRLRNHRNHFVPVLQPEHSEKEMRQVGQGLINSVGSYCRCFFNANDGNWDFSLPISNDKMDILRSEGIFNLL